MSIKDAIKEAKATVKRILLGTKALMAADKAENKRQRSHRGLQLIMPRLIEALKEAEVAAKAQDYKTARKALDSVKKNEAVLVENFKEVYYYTQEAEKNIDKARRLGALSGNAAVELREQTNG